MKLIDADKLKKEIEYYIMKVGWNKFYNEALKWCIDFIDNEPPIEPERTAKVVPAAQEMLANTDIIVTTSCELCERSVTLRDKYCPNCGARLEWE